MAWYSRFINWRGRGPESDAAATENEVEVDFDEAEPRGRRRDDDAYSPARKRAEILARVRLDAEADAIRHAEDMLNRDFPIVGYARTTAEGRLADLETAYLFRRTPIDERIEGLTTEIVAIERNIR